MLSRSFSSHDDDEFSDPWAANRHDDDNDEIYPAKKDAIRAETTGSQSSDEPSVPTAETKENSSSDSSGNKDRKAGVSTAKAAVAVVVDDSDDESSTLFPNLQYRSGESLVSFPSQGDASEWAELSTILGREPNREEEPVLVEQRQEQLQQRGPSNPPTDHMEEDYPDPPLDLSVEDFKEKLGNVTSSTTYDFVGEDYGDDEYGMMSDEDEDDDSQDRRCCRLYSPKKKSDRDNEVLEPETSVRVTSVSKGGGPSYLPDRILRGFRKEPLKRIEPEKSMAALKNKSSFEAGQKPRAPSSAISLQASETMVTPPNVFLRSIGVPSPLTIDYDMLLQDPAYLHAQRAGTLWQSIVGQQVRFPSRWWDGARTPPLGIVGGDAQWQYLGRAQLRSNKFLNRLVKNRSQPGRILLHIIVQDLVTGQPVQDIAVGCFHPNARGIRSTAAANPDLEKSRDVWVAVRRRLETSSAIDALLSRGQPWEYYAWKSPIGRRRRVTNANMRAVYGELPPVETLFIPESELYEKLSTIRKNAPKLAPPVALLEEFVFD